MAKSCPFHVELSWDNVSVAAVTEEIRDFHIQAVEKAVLRGEYPRQLRPFVIQELERLLEQEEGCGQGNKKTEGAVRHG